VAAAARVIRPRALLPPFASASSTPRALLPPFAGPRAAHHSARGHRPVGTLAHSSPLCLRLLHSPSSPPPFTGPRAVHHSATGHRPVGTLAAAESQRSAHGGPPARVHEPGTSVVPLLPRAWRPAPSATLATCSVREP